MMWGICYEDLWAKEQPELTVWKHSKPEMNGKMTLSLNVAWHCSSCESLGSSLLPGDHLREAMIIQFKYNLSGSSVVLRYVTDTSFDFTYSLVLLGYWAPRLLRCTISIVFVKRHMHRSFFIRLWKYGAVFINNTIWLLEYCLLWKFQ